MLWIRTKAFEDLSSGMYKSFLAYVQFSSVHYSGKWLLGTTNVGSSVTCPARQWISRTDPKKTCRVCFNLQEMVPFVFGNFSATWRFNNLSLHCSSEVPYPPQISIADASVEDKFQTHNPKPALRTRFWRMYNSVLHYSRKWLLGAYDVDSSAACQVRQWISRTESTNAWPFRFNLQEMIPIVFGDRSAF
ncbi:hypothetical protein LXL04_022637 [Taraxacum kok-saghyz]